VRGSKPGVKRQRYNKAPLTLADFPLSFLKYLREAFRLARVTGDRLPDSPLYTKKYITKRWGGKLRCGRRCAEEFSRWFVCDHKTIDQEKADNLYIDLKADRISASTYHYKLNKHCRRIAWRLPLENDRVARARRFELEAYLAAGCPGMKIVFLNC
jgi:hypothetical protein